MGSEAVSSMDYLKFKKVEDIQSSSKYLFWVEKRSKIDKSGYNTQIFRYSKSEKSIREFTSGSEQDFLPRISPDEKYLAFVSTRSKKPQVFIMPMDGGEAMSITPPHLKAVSLEWSPVSTHLAIIARIDREFQEDSDDKDMDDLDAKVKEIDDQKKKRSHEDPRVITELVYKTDTSFIEDWESPQVYIYNLESKELDRISSLEYKYQGLQWAGSSSVLSYTRLDKPADLSKHLDLVRLNLGEEIAGEKVTRLYNPFIFQFQLRVNPHDPNVILSGIFEDLYEQGMLAQISKWAVITDSQHEIINKELDRSIYDLKWMDEDNALVAIGHHGTVDVRRYRHSDRSISTIYEPTFSVESFHGQSTDDFVVIGSSPNHPSAIWAYTNGDFELLYDPNAELLQDKKIVEPEVVWLTNEEGFEYQGWFFEAEGDNRPLILSIHGGPHVMWTNAGSMWLEWQSQVAAGYSVLALNPVGSDGYGEDYLRQIVAEWGVKDGRDELKAIDYIVENKSIDNDRLYVTGGSYAGYQVAHLISIDQRFKAACAQRGVYNLITLDAGTDIPNFNEYEYFGPGPKDVKKLWEHSPISRADSMKTPLLLIHSEYDYRVSVGQAEELFLALRSRGVEVEFVRYPDEGHELSRSGTPRRLIDRLDRMMKWFEDH